MKAIGVKQFKAHLSEYIRLAKAGETVLVTEREQIVAELRPARRQFPAPSAEADILDELAESGTIERASLNEGAWAPRGIGLRKGTAARLLDATREER